MPHKYLLPNHHLKSMIEQWREEQKGEAARQKKLKDLLTQMQWCTTSDEVTVTLSAISEFVAETETLIPAAQLTRAATQVPLSIADAATAASDATAKLATPKITEDPRSY